MPGDHLNYYSVRFNVRCVGLCNQSCYNGDGSEVPREVVLQFLVDEEACSRSPIISFALQSSVVVHVL